LNRKFKN